MPIRIACGECAKELKLADTLAGKTIKCPQCQAKISVPAAAEPEPSKPVKATPAKKSARPTENEDDAAPSKKVKKKKKEAAGTNPLVLWGGVGVSGAVLFGCCGFFTLAFFLSWWPFTKTNSTEGGGSGISGDGALAKELKYFPEDCGSLLSFRYETMVRSESFKESRKPFSGVHGQEFSYGVKNEAIERTTTLGAEGGFVIIITTNRPITFSEAKEWATDDRGLQQEFNEETIGNYTMAVEKRPGGRAFCVPEDRIVVRSTPEHLRALLSRNARPSLPGKFKRAYLEADFNATKVSISTFPAGYNFDATCEQVELGPTVTFMTTHYCRDSATADKVIKQLEDYLQQDKVGETTVDVEKRKHTKVTRDGTKIYLNASLEEKVLLDYIKKDRRGGIPGFSG